jgi:SGNH domain (fused to AT3 domains)
LAGGVMALATSCGIALSMSQGWVQRYSVADRDLVGVSFIERGDFVRKRFESQHHRPFDSSDARTRVLLIGDSYAKDFINGVAASDWAQRVQISTHSISVGCGNLYVQDDLSRLVTNSYPPLCETEGRYRSDALKQLMQQAEVIWLVTSWQPWEVRFLKQSLDALRRDFGDKFVVVGAKSFGDIQPRQLLAVPESARAQHANPVSAAFLANNQAVAQASLGVPFVNKHRLMCGSGSTCATFTQHARLISYDGGHLTQFGADKLGRELSAPAVVQRLLGQAQRPAP